MKPGLDELRQMCPLHPGYSTRPFCPDCRAAEEAVRPVFPEADSVIPGGLTNRTYNPPSPLDTQVGGDHYKKLGDYQPWEVLRRWLTPEEFRGFMKGTAIAYLAREKDKGGTQDIEKAMHTLAGFIDLEAKP